MVKGYKVFEANWQCKGKQYTCPGIFEEDVEPHVCESGMHFCKVAVDCFEYYLFRPYNKVAEVIAYGDIAEEGNKCCTNKLEIVREIPWAELLEIVNTGKGCTGRGNIGDCNTGNYNSGNYNSGNYNSGSHNSGYSNGGKSNSGHYNTGDYNSGHYNTGNYNTGNYNRGRGNSGHWNSGNWNTGNYNSGNRNTGDWNKTNYSNGCFNTEDTKIYLFNKPSEWTYVDWLNSDAHYILATIPDNILWVSHMTDDEKKEHPEAEFTGGYLKEVNTSKSVINWWHSLAIYEKRAIKAIPNFDKEIFKEITGIDVDK